MRCPDWRRLLAARERGGGEDPPGWREALEHLDDCSRCRRAALEAEPLLALRRLPEADLEPDEGRRMVAATRALRRRQAAATHWRRRAAAAVAVVTVGAALTVGSGVLEREEGTRSEERGTSAMVAQREETGEPAPTSPAAAASAPAAAGSSDAPAPTLLDVEQPTARVYEVTDADLAVVVVVDRELDMGDHG